METLKYRKTSHARGATESILWKLVIWVKAIYRFCVISIKFQIRFFTRLEKKHKIDKEAQNSQNYPEQKEQC